MGMFSDDPVMDASLFDLFSSGGGGSSGGSGLVGKNNHSKVLMFEK